MLIRKLFFLIFSGLIICSFISCEDKFKPLQTTESIDDLPSQESWNSTVTFSDSGNVKAVLKAGHILVYSKKGFTLIDSGAVVDFYKDGEITSTLSGEKGKINDKTKDIEIYDSVHVISKDGSELKTQKLLWTNLTQRVSSDLFVSIKTPNETIEGIGFESDQNLKNYKIFKVSGTF